MKRRTKKLTIPEHKQLGEDLKRARDILLVWTVKLGNTYGVASRQEKLSYKAQKTVDDLCSIMDDRLFVEWPDDFTTFVYYPREGE